MNIGSVLTQAAQKSPDHTAIIFGDLRRTYRELNARANRLADQLRKAGVRKGDRVAILQHNCPELLETLFATFKAGGITVPINARLHPKEFAYILQDSGTKVPIISPPASTVREASLARSRHF
jgi:fatty-acyl-CoA synthase